MRKRVFRPRKRSGLRFVVRGAMAVGGAATVLFLAACGGGGGEAEFSQDTRLSDHGYVAMNEGNLLDAEIYLEAALQINPSNPFALLNMGVVYQRSGRIDRARELYAKVVSLDPALTAAGSNDETLASASLADIARANLAAFAGDDLQEARRIDPAEREAVARLVANFDLYRASGAIDEPTYAAAREELLSRVPADERDRAVSLETAAPAADTEEASESSATPSAANPAQGAVYAHLASFRSFENAERGWSELSRDFSDLLEGLGHRIGEIDLGPEKGVFYRVYAGPLSDSSAARNLCGAFKQRALYCLAATPSAAELSKPMQTAKR